jgi:glutamate synthase (NADPH/NADH) small chain
MTISTFTKDNNQPKTKVTATVYFDRCAGCEDCLVRCPVGAISIDDVDWVVTVDEGLCVGCHQCERLCPFGAIETHGAPLVPPHLPTAHVTPTPLFVSTLETRRGYESLSAAKLEAQRCLGCPDPTCVRGCPAHNDIPGFIDAIRRSAIDEAKDILSRTSFLSDVCSRVCNQSAQCEGACSLALAGDEPVGIGALERFVADHAKTETPAVTAKSPGGPKVAIVGSGPAAIGAAGEILRKGGSVDVFERAPIAGGLLRYGIPAFSLPDQVAKRPWEELVRDGANLYLNTEIDRAALEELKSTYDAVIVAHGASRAIAPPAKVSADVAVQNAEEVLETLGESLETGYAHPGWIDRDVLVVGGGNTAMDVGRMAIRNGARPFVVEWLNRKYSPVRSDELSEAELEGVRVLFEHTVLSLESTQVGRVRAVIAKTSQPHKDRLPKIIKHSETVQDFDIVVAALGFQVVGDLLGDRDYRPVRKDFEGIPDRTWMASGILAKTAATRVGELALAREVGLQKAEVPYTENVWVVGDALVGPSTVVEAMAQGVRAASAIVKYHQGKLGR